MSVAPDQEAAYRDAMELAASHYSDIQPVHYGPYNTMQPQPHLVPQAHLAPPPVYARHSGQSDQVRQQHAQEFINSAPIELHRQLADYDEYHQQYAGMFEMQVRQEDPRFRWAPTQSRTQVTARQATGRPAKRCLDVSDCPAHNTRSAKRLRALSYSSMGDGPLKADTAEVKGLLAASCKSHGWLGVSEIRHSFLTGPFGSFYKEKDYPVEYVKQLLEELVKEDAGLA